MRFGSMRTARRHTALARCRRRCRTIALSISRSQCTSAPARPDTRRGRSVRIASPPRRPDPSLRGMPCKCESIIAFTFCRNAALLHDIHVDRTAGSHNHALWRPAGMRLMTARRAQCLSALARLRARPGTTRALQRARRRGLRLSSGHRRAAPHRGARITRSTFLDIVAGRAAAARHRPDAGLELDLHAGITGDDRPAGPDRPPSASCWSASPRQVDLRYELRGRRLRRAPDLPHPQLCGGLRNLSRDMHRRRRHQHADRHLRQRRHFGQRQRRSTGGGSDPRSADQGRSRPTTSGTLEAQPRLHPPPGRGVRPTARQACGSAPEGCRNADLMLNRERHRHGAPPLSTPAAARALLAGGAARGAPPGDDRGHDRRGHPGRRLPPGIDWTRLRRAETGR